MGSNVIKMFLTVGITIGMTVGIFHMAGHPLIRSALAAQDQVNFGSSTCPTRVPCPDTVVEPPSSAEFASIANKCAISGLGLTSDEGFFDEYSGLDLDNCVSIKSDLINKKDPRVLLPKCCIKTLSDNTCAFFCQLLNNWH